MRSLTPTGTILVVALASAGCKAGVISLQTGDAGTAPVMEMPSDDGGAAPSMPEVSAQEFFRTRVEPILELRCAGCHGADRAGPDFLRPNPDVRTTLLTYPALVNLDAPASSRLLTKGEHAGPAFRAAEAELVRTWIELEAAEGGRVDTDERELATAAEPVREGFNALALDALGLPGTAIHFVAERIAGGMFLADVRVAAGPTGAHLVHPTFVVWIEGTPHPDPVDRFAELEVEVPPNSTRPFEPDAIALTEFPDGARLSIHFDRVAPVGVDSPRPDADGGMPGGMAPDGCRQLEAFRSMVSPQLGTYCTRCHAGGSPSATSALDMRNVQARDDATLRLGCNQILGRIPPATPSASGLFVQTDPSGGSMHPFRFRTTREFDAFTTAVLGWFEREMTP
jgi:hypothetical protein